MPLGQREADHPGRDVVEAEVARRDQHPVGIEPRPLGVGQSLDPVDLLDEHRLLGVVDHAVGGSHGGAQLEGRPARRRTRRTGSWPGRRPAGRRRRGSGE